MINFSNSIRRKFSISTTSLAVLSALLSSSGAQAMDKSEFDPFKCTRKAVPLQDLELDPDKSRAAQGDLDAQQRYGVKLVNQNNLIDGFYYLTSAANKGHKEAQFTLGDCYQHGKRVPKDPVKAVSYYKSAADEGHTKAQFALANMYGNGEGVDVDKEKGLYYLKLAAKKGNHPEAQYGLGYRAAMLDKSEKAYRYYRLAAIQGHTKAQNALILASNQGKQEAQHEVASLLFTGKVFARDQKKAFQLYTVAANQGNANAQFALASLLEGGVTERECIGHGCSNVTTIVAKDETQAFQYYNLAANQGHADALYQLGCIYNDGLFKITEQSNNDGCQGGMYETFRTVTTVICAKNPQKARLYFQQAAARGHEGAQKRL